MSSKELGKQDSEDLCFKKIFAREEDIWERNSGLISDSNKISA
jgi:hypothetical protein